MNRSGLINTLKDEAKLSRKDAEKIVNTFFGSLAETLSDGNRVEIRGFGTFTVRNYNTYVGRNPKTGAKITVSPKKLPFFKVGKNLKEKADNKS